MIKTLLAKKSKKISVFSVKEILDSTRPTLEPPYPQHNNVPFNLNHEKRITYFDKIRNCGFNVNHLLQY